ncbi:SDR family NAD(P)-dependent oxidoreductase [Sulfitobacter mediterraneus]|uniref:SDR family NAD(P)-dependent oxidoreductase n=2 Tax=Sulfitobacter mediterraneus TaxID=83219 RepID=UPI001E338714|nr:SDR family oxidoreductase [Sulfitobacter mediterraneus]MCD2362807.1 SDR family oxidoreductase [Sulfitobacter mediterraneus]
MKSISERILCVIGGCHETGQIRQNNDYVAMSAAAEFDFSGARIIVIGASRGGIGAAIARAFQDAGGDVEITGAEPECLPEDAARFGYTQLDVTDTDAVDSFAKSRDEVDVLVNCAAITKRGEEMDAEFFQHVLNVNLVGSMRCAKALHGALAKRQGRVINIASMYARFGSPRNPAYGASKAGVEQMTKSLAIAWASDGVRVNAIAPGFIVTEQSARARQDQAFTDAVEARTPLGRWGQPDDIAGLALFLGSDASKFMTGVCVPVDGGYSVV